MATVRNRDREEVLPRFAPTPEEPSKGTTKALEWVNYAFMIFLAIGIKTWQPLAIAKSQRPDGSYAFNKTMMVILVEFIKLVFCACVLGVVWFQTHPAKRSALVNLPFLQSLHFLVPSVLYGVSNTVVYHGMGYIHPALFHIFGNFRIIIAGILYRFIMGKKNTDTQWAALVLLTAGAILASPEISNPEVLDSSNTFYGMVLIVIMCLCSTSSSIYIELNYKKTEELSIFFQNIVLYVYGIAINALYLIVTDDGTVAQNGIFYGFDSSSYEVLFVQSMMGISLSFFCLLYTSPSPRDS